MSNDFETWHEAPVTGTVKWCINDDPGLSPGIKKTDNSRFYSDLEFDRPIFFAKSVKKIGPKINLFSVEYLNKNTQGHLKW